MDEESSKKFKPIQSFVRRSSRLTQAQRQAIDLHWDKWGLDPQTPLDLETVFGRKAPIWLEIGIGNASCLLDMAAKNPHIDFIGMEVHQPGIGRALMGMAEEGLTNIRLYEHDAVEVLKNAVPNHSLDRLLLFFPDPWHKKRHYKRRIVQDEFVELISTKMKLDGVWHIATDWEDYALWSQEVLSKSLAFVEERPFDDAHQKPDYRPSTHFERRGEKLGHEIWDLLYRRTE